MVLMLTLQLRTCVLVELNGLAPLHLAARNLGSVPIVKLVSQNRKYKLTSFISASLHFLRLLHYAAEGGDWRMVKYVLETLNRSHSGEIVNQCNILRQTTCGGYGYSVTSG